MNKRRAATVGPLKPTEQPRCYALESVKETAATRQIESILEIDGSEDKIQRRWRG
jgi:hypothetical protein